MGAAPILTILKDGEAVKSVPVEGEALLGRSDACVIRLDDRAVSRQHALFRQVAGGLQVEKKSDFAPLAVNGTECTSALLKEGDLIAIGPYLVRVSMEKAARRASNQQPSPMPTSPPPGLMPSALGAPMILEAPAAAPIQEPISPQAGASALPSALPNAPLNAPLNAPPPGAFAPALAAVAPVPETLGAELGRDTASPALSLTSADPAPVMDLNALAPAGTAPLDASASGSVTDSAPGAPGSFEINLPGSEAALSGPAGGAAPGATDPSQTPLAPSTGAAPGADAAFGLPGMPDSAQGGIVLEPPPSLSDAASDGETGVLKLNALPQSELDRMGTGSSQPLPSLPSASSSQQPDPLAGAGGLGTSPGSDGVTNAAGPTGLEVRLVFNAGDANHTEFDMSGKPEISLGRGTGCDIILNDKKVSRKHAVIIRNGFRFTIKDLKSANGIYVNGVRVTEQDLASGDRIRIGSVEFSFQARNPGFEDQKREFMPVSAAQTGDIESPSRGGALQSFPAYPGLAGALMPPPDNRAGMGGAAAPSPAMQPGLGMAGIPGLTGTAKPKSLMEKFRALPKRRQYIWIVIVIGLVYFLLFDDDAEKKAAKPKAKAVAANVATPTASGQADVTFDALTPEQQKFVESQHALAFDYYRNREYDKALFEIQKIFALIPDYKDSREIERYAREGQRKLEAMEDEKRRKDEETKLKAKIASLVEETRTLMSGKHYEQARELFSQILALDPDNKDVAQWRQVLDDYDEQQRLAQQEQQVRDEINQRAWSIYKGGIALKSQGHYHAAIDELGKVMDLSPSDTSVVAKAKAGIASCRSEIVALRDPVFAEAKEAEQNEDFAKAFSLYKKTTVIDPPFQEGYSGMARVRGILHDKAKVIYTEAVLAESYSDFGTAKKKYNEVLATAPTDDIYHDRAERKLAHYFEKEDTSQ